jgi:hypothetical protein
MKAIKFGICGCGLMGKEFAGAAGRWMRVNEELARPEIVASRDPNPAARSATAAIFEFRFADAILQMWASFMKELKGRSVKFGCVRPEETALSYDLQYGGAALVKGGDGGGDRGSARRRILARRGVKGNGSEDTLGD